MEVVLLFLLVNSSKLPKSTSCMAPENVWVWGRPVPEPLDCFPAVCSVLFQLQAQFCSKVEPNTIYVGVPYRKTLVVRLAAHQPFILELYAEVVKH